MPHTILVAVVSHDGKIADAKGEQKMLTCEPDRQHLLKQMAACDTQLYGYTTYAKFIAPLKRYRCIVATRKTASFEEIRPQHYLWNPQSVSFTDVCQRVGAHSICLLGGSEIYSLAKREGWIDELSLSYVPNINLPGGIPLFNDIPDSKLWDALDSGKLGFTPTSKGHNILPGCENFEFPLELRTYKRI